MQEYNYAIAFQERIRVSDEKMQFYEELARCTWAMTSAPTSTAVLNMIMWEYRHCGESPRHQEVPKAMRDRCASKIEGGKSSKSKSLIPDTCVQGVAERAALVGDAAGYVTKALVRYLLAAKFGRGGEAFVEHVRSTCPLRAI